MKTTDKIYELVENCDSSHYLKRSKENKNAYFQKFVNTILTIENKLSIKQLNDLLDNKMLLKQNFKDFVYIQSATELSVNLFFYNLSPSTFEYEIKMNPDNKKDIDCQVEIEHIKYNIEVKCPDLEDKLNVSDDTLKVSFGTRMPNHDKVLKDVKSITANILNSSKSSYKKTINVKRDDNKMKEYLIGAHKKFIDNDGLNVLIVPLNSPESFDEWLAYLIEPNAGLFTDKSYISVSKFNKVDIVVFTNLVNSHLNYNKSPISNPWDFSKHFNIVQCNPYRLRDKKEAILKFYKNLIPNYSDDFAKHFKELDSVSQTTGVKSFVVEFVEKELKLNYFV